MATLNAEDISARHCRRFPSGRRAGQLQGEMHRQEAAEAVEKEVAHVVKRRKEPDQSGRQRNYLTLPPILMLPRGVFLARSFHAYNHCSGDELAYETCIHLGAEYSEREVAKVECPSFESVGDDLP